MVRLIQSQLAVCIVLTAILLVFDWVAGYSAFFGGLIATVANAWFAVKVFKRKTKIVDVDQSELAAIELKNMYVGEIYKFVLTGSLFIITFVLLKPVNAGALLSVYFVVHLVPAVVNTFGAQD